MTSLTKSRNNAGLPGWNLLEDLENNLFHNSMFRAPVNYRDYQVVESDDAIDVRMDVPGATRQDLDVTVKNGYLTVKSERQDVTDGSRASKSFSFKVGSGYEAEDLEASLENGVLTVSLPKEKKQEIKVEIR